MFDAYLAQVVPEYQPLIALRQSAATDVMITLEGL
jgi:hypothetical protein